MGRKWPDELAEGEVRAGIPTRNKGVSGRQMVTAIGHGSTPLTHTQTHTLLQLDTKHCHEAITKTACAHTKTAQMLLNFPVFFTNELISTIWLNLLSG